MTNPAEKIRQIVEEKTNLINENESFFPDKESARSHVVHIVVPVLDAIIDWKQQQLRTLRIEAKENTTLYCSVLLDKLHLEEARTSLTTTL